MAEFERYSRLEEHWEEAVALYTGDLLENLYEDWVFFEQERLRALCLDILMRLAWKFQSQGDYSRAIRYGAQLLAADPLREDSVRLLMSLRYRAGDRAGALKEYEECKERLRRELGVEPMPETIALYEAIARNAPLPGEALPAVGANHDSPLHLRPRPLRLHLPFVGRAAEMEEVGAAWSRAAAHQGGLILIGGEAGIGKSRLVAELAALVERQGGRVLYGSATFGEPRPYQPFQEALQNALPLVAALPISPLSLSAVAHLLPELRLRRAGLPALTHLDPEREKTRFFDSLAECLEALARPRPLLLILEDLHWAGAATIALLEFLARRFVHRPLLIAGTYREEETPRTHPLRDLRRRLQREGLITHVALGRLALAAVETLIAQVSGLGGDLAHRLYGESEGNPLFLSERLHDLIESGQVRVEEGGWQIRISEERGIPRGVKETILERLARLSSEARTLAETAAVLGPAFDVELLRETGGWSESQTLDALRELLDRQLVREASVRGRFDYCFSHHLIQETVYAAMVPENCRRRHRRAAEVMEELYASQADEVAGEVARHFEQGGEPERAAEWYLRAAQRAAKLYADEEALAHLERALALTAAPRLRFDLLALQESILHRRGDREAQKACLEQLEVLAHSLGEEERICETLWRRILFERALGEREAEAALIAELKKHAPAVGGEIWPARARQAEAAYRALLGQYEAATSLAHEALKGYQAAPDVQGQVECLYLLASIAVQQGQFEQAQRYVAEVQGLAQGNQSLAVQALRVAIAAAFVRQDLASGLRLTEQMLTLCQSIHDRDGEADARTHLGVILARLFRLHEARQHYAEAEKVYRAIGKRQGQAAVLINAGLLALMHLGRYDEAHAAFEQADDIFRRLDDLRGQTIAALNLALAALYQEDYPVAKAAAQRALELAHAMQSAPLEANALGNLGAAERELGELSQAIEHMEAGLAIRRELGQAAELGADLCDLTLAYLRAGRLEDARLAAEELLSLHASNADAITHPQYILWAAAQTCDALGETQRARELLTQAYRILQERADAIPDPESRATFLALPLNRQIGAAYKSL